MLITEQKERIIDKIGVSDEDSTEMGIDEESTHLVMKFLSKNIYTDSSGSCIREYVSNAIDSHTKAGNITDTIEVKLYKTENNNYCFSVKDFGVGLDEDDVKNVISKYMKSTKRLDDKALGSFGKN